MSAPYYCTENNSYPLFYDGQIQPGLLYDLGTRILVSFIIPTVVSFGIMANGIFLFAVYRIRSMRNITNLYLVNLSIADLVFLITAGGKSIYQYLYYPYMDDTLSLGAAGCAIITAITYTSYFASIAIITLVSLERFYAVTQPLKHRLIHSHWRVAKLLIGSWVLALLLGALVTPGFSSLTVYCLAVPDEGEYANLPEMVGYCDAVGIWAKYLETCVQACPFFIALVGNFYLYIRIIRCLNKRFDNLDDDTNQSNTQPRSQAHATHIRNAVALMLIANGVIFFFCQFLARVLMLSQLMKLLVGLSIPEYCHYVLMILSRILLFVNASINPVIYNVTNARYRKATRQAFSCQTGSHGETSTTYTGPSKQRLVSTGYTEETQGVSNGLQPLQTSDIDTEV